MKKRFDVVDAEIKCAMYISYEIKKIIEMARTDEEIIELMESAGYTDFDIFDNGEWFEVSAVAHLNAGEVSGVDYPYLKQLSFQLDWETDMTDVYFGEGAFKIGGEWTPEAWLYEKEYGDR